MRRKEKEYQFNEIISMHGDGLYRICKAYLYDATLSQDLYQEVLLNIWKSLSSFQGKSSIKTWLFRIAINTTISFNKKQSRRKEKEDSIEVNISTSNESNELLEKMYSAIQQLADHDKRLIGLFLEGFSYKEISSITGMTTNLVGIKLNRIKEKLKRIISSKK